MSKVYGAYQRKLAVLETGVPIEEMKTSDPKLVTGEGNTCTPYQSFNTKMPSIGQAILFIALFYLCAFMLDFLFYLLFEDMFNADTWSGSAEICFELISQTIGLAIVLLLGKRWAQCPWMHVLPFRRFSTPVLLALLPFVFGWFLINAEFVHVIGNFLETPGWIKEIRETEYRFAYNHSRHFFWYATFTVVVTPFMEEAFFRGFLMNGFLNRYRPSAAIVVSALLFAAMHFDLNVVTSSFISGLIYGWMRVVTGSLWPCVVMHMLNNAFCYLMPFLWNQILVANDSESITFQPPWMLSLGVLLLAVSGFFIHRKLHSQKDI